MTSVAVSAVVGLVVAALLLVGLAYPGFGRDHLMAIAESNVIVFYITFSAAYAVCALLLWAGGIVLEFLTFRRAAPSAPAADFNGNKKTLTTIYGEIQTAQANVRPRLGVHLADKPGSLPPLERLTGIRVLRGEFWREATRRLIIQIGAFVLIAVATGLIAKQFALANTLAASVFIDGVIGALAVAFGVASFGWVEMDREIEQAAERLVRHAVTNAGAAIVTADRDRTSERDAAHLAQLERIEQGIAQADASIRDDLRALASMLGTLATSLKLGSSAPVTPDVGPLLERLVIELERLSATGRRADGRWDDIEGALNEIRTAQRDLTVAYADRVAPIPDAGAGPVPSGKPNSAILARKVRAILDDIGPTSE